MRAASTDSAQSGFGRRAGFTQRTKERAMKTKQQKRVEALARLQYARQAGFNGNPKPSNLKCINDLREKLGMPPYDEKDGAA